MNKTLTALLAALVVLFACKPDEPNVIDKPEDKPEEVDKTVHVTGISLNPPSITIMEEEYADIEATVTPANADDKTVTWSSSDSQVASVSGTGRVTGVKAGTATITATTKDGGKTATCEVTVQKNPDPSVTVGSSNISAVSAVLQGKANLKSSAPADLNVGFQYSKSAGITAANSTKVDAVDVDASYNYTATIAGLEPGTKYYFRSFVHQNGEDSFGEILEFTTKDAASLLETKGASGIEAAKAELNAGIDLTDVKYSSMSYGFYWGTSESSQPTFLAGGDIASKAFSATLANLTHQTQYWYKAYLKLDSQTFYGEVKTFTTGTVPVSSVSLDKPSYSFNTIGGTVTLTATVLPADATNKAIEWSSSKSDVAIVDANGKVTAKGNGTATITVTTKDQYKQATCTITVAQVVTGVSLSEPSITLNEGQSKTLTVTVSPSNAANKSVNWTSTNSSVARVDANGVVTAVSLGTATIKAEAKDGSGKFATCAVTVRRPVTSITLNKTELVLYRAGEDVTATLTATVTPSNAENTAVTWSSSNTAIVAVSNTGVVTGKLPGTATITVAAQDGNGAKATCTVYVRSAVNTITVSRKKLDMIIGEEATLSVPTILPQNAYDKSYTWSTSDNTVASVDSNGKVTAKATGKATIKVTANDRGVLYAACEVTVAPKPTAVDMGTVVNGKNVKWASFNIGATNQYEYGYYFAWGETDTKETYYWAYYKYGTSDTALTKYNTSSSYGTVDNKTVLDPEDDAARVKLGGGWRMPTEAEWNALKTNCTWEWKVLNGVFGVLVTASNGNRLYLPAAGIMTGNALDLAGSYGYYWSTSIGTTPAYGLSFMFLVGSWHTEKYYRPYGCSVRAVTE